MSLYTLNIFCVFTFGLFLAGETKFPAATCKRDLTDYSACLRRALEEAWPLFVKGLPEYDFPSLDPLVFEHATATLKLGEIRGEIIATNLTAIGLSKAHFSDVRAHYLDDVFNLEIDVDVPWLYAEGGVNVNGSLNVFKITGKGKIINSI
ncbi:hypothetical protein PUN28_000991 [Cardiocondyla obscurior]|uniref:Uncharacterized protein n=1 Tax=Cardiocondyla obscurior TaxID=286306 RepID=A0AAW2H2B6_9HYME